MNAPDGFHYIVVLTFPSGNKFAVGESEGNLALLPIGKGDKEMPLRGVLAFKDSISVSKWMKEFLKGLDAEKRKSFLSLRPDLALAKIAM